MQSAVDGVARRFWARHGHGHSADDNGFLRDPADTIGGGLWANAETLTERDLRIFRTVVLLGEPGMGKSTFLNRAGPLLPYGCDAVVVDVDLAEFGSEDRLVRSVFECQEVQRWLAGDGELCLTLDGFDDAQTRIPHLGSMLAAVLRRWPMGRLWLRIVCRTSDWPQSMADTLSQRKPSVQVELLPLRRCDVATLAGKWEVDSEGFLAAVEARHVGALAARPLTLGFLLRAFAKDGRLPGQAAELYRQSLLALCDEQNPARRAALPAGVSPSELYVAARRVAAASVFGGVTAVWVGPLPCPTGEDLITIDDLAGGTEPTATGGVEITPALVREATRTPLFSGRGEARRGWAHTTFQDFLAADWLLANNLSGHQVRSLLLADDGGVRPQVRRVAAWAVSLAPEQWGWPTESDPESFVGEVDIPDPVLREALVDRLLAPAATYGRSFHPFTRYSGLAHPGLSDQLMPILTEDGPSRPLAIRLVRDCDVTECDPALVALALDPQAPIDDRVAAGWALINRRRTGGLLLPLVNDETVRGKDNDYRDLLGIGLLASWPHALTTEQALQALFQLEGRRPGGTPEAFIAELSQAFTTEDVAAAAAWLSRTEAIADGRWRGQVRDACLNLCVEHLDHPAAAAAVVAAAMGPLLRDDPILYVGYHPPEKFRRQLCLLLVREVETVADVDADLAASVFCAGALLRSADDFLWLLDRAGTDDPAEKAAIHRLLPLLVDPTRADHANAVLSLDSSSPLRQVFSAWLDACDLSDPKVIETRAQWRRSRQRRARRNNPPDDIADRIIQHLNRFESGDPNGYWHAAHLVCVRPDTQHYNEEHQHDLDAHPRWGRLPATVRNRLVGLAPRYLAEGRCVPERWLGTGRLFHPAEAGYWALLLLLRHDPSALDTLSASVWQEWAPIIIAWPTPQNRAQDQSKNQLLRYALPHAREQLRTALLAVIDRAIHTDSPWSRRIEVDLLWDDHLQAELTIRLTGPLPADVRTDFAETFLCNAPGAAQTLLISWLGKEPELSTLAAALLLRHRAQQTWPAIDRWLTDHPEDGDKVFLELNHDQQTELLNLPTETLIDLCLWLWTRFPPDQDPRHHGAHWVSPRESAGRLRNDLLERLCLTGTDESVAAVRRIADRHPENGRLELVYRQACAAHRQKTWRPTASMQLRLLAEDHRRRLVRTNKELLDAITAALDTIQQRLIGESPESHLLWDTAARQPKAEDEISDYLRNRLTDQLDQRHLVVNREVQVRRNRPAGIGERTDLRIDAPTSDDGTITAVIEVKTAWADDVTTALPNQLANQYMNDIGTNAGIFVVLWTNIEYWTETSSARNKARSVERSTLTEHLNHQASEQMAFGRDVRVVHLDMSYLRTREGNSVG